MRRSKYWLGSRSSASSSSTGPLAAAFAGAAAAAAAACAACSANKNLMAPRLGAGGWCRGAQQGLVSGGRSSSQVAVC